MPASDRRCYHLPRWPLFRQTVRCFLWIIFGLLVLNFPNSQYLYWAGLIPITWAIIFWFIILSPKWHYTIHTDYDNLYIRGKVYPWADITELKMERESEHRILRLSGHSERLPYQVFIRDDILRFDELAQECFWHVNTPNEESKLGKDQIYVYPNQGGINP